MGLFGSSGGLSPTDAARLARIEAKLDALLTSLDLKVKEPDGMADIREVARDPGRKIEAIKMYRELTGAGLYDAKQAVDAMEQGD